MSADSLFNEGLQRARTGDHVSACALLRQSLAQDADRAETSRLLGKVCLQLGRMDEAEACWKRALALEPSDNESALCLRLMRRHRRLRRLAGAAALLIVAAVTVAASWYYQQSLSRVEGSLARIEKQLGKVGQPQSSGPPPAAPPSAPVVKEIAPPVREPVQEEGVPPVRRPAPPSPPAPRPGPQPSPAPGVQVPPPPATPRETTLPFADRYKTALSAALAGELTRARGLFEPLASEAYAREPLAGNAHFWLGRCLYELGNTRSALERFHHVLANYPRSPKVGDAILDIGRCHLRLGDTEKARQAWQSLLEGRYEARVKEAARRLMREAGF